MITTAFRGALAMLARKICRRHHATVDDQRVPIDKGRIVADQKHLNSAVGTFRFQAVCILGRGVRLGWLWD
jgi:hypothetical protein